MTSPYVVVTVTHTPGGKLPNGSPSGIGGETAYGLAITTDGIDRQPVDGHTFDSPREASRYAERLQRRLTEART